METPVPFYICAALSQFFFCGFNTAIYAIIPDCVEYGEWKTGIRNDGFQYAFVSLGNKLGMAIGTAALAGVLGMLGFKANQVQSAAVQSVIHHSFSTIPGVLWLVTAAVLAVISLFGAEGLHYLGTCRQKRCSGRPGANAPQSKQGGAVMEAVTVSLTQVNQVQQFVSLVSKVPYDVDMVSGRYTINAKSLLGIYSLDLNRPLQVVMYSDDCEELKKALEAFMV